MIAITPLEQWIRRKAHITSELEGRSFLKALSDYQLQRVNETISYARHNSAFYRRHLASCATAPLATLSDIDQIPFTTASDLTRDPFRFLAVRQDDVARIVTLRTSGSTSDPKRLFFSDDDLELTIDFFHHGMSTIVRPGQKVAVLLPSEQTDSVGDLLIRGLGRMDVAALAYGPVKDPLQAIRDVASFGADCVVGIPTQVLAMARSSLGPIGKGCIESVLLSTDYVPHAIVRSLEEVWGCRVFNHYGMTEMGLGGGVECEALDGYHLREGDLYFEVVDHETGARCPDGVMGEVVFTTLTRRAMPLVRYRTGDMGRIIRESCPCGSALRRMERVKGRWDGAFRLGPESTLMLSDMDEALFRLPDLLDYRVTLSECKDGRFRLHIDVCRAEDGNTTSREILQMLSEVDAIQKAITTANLEIPLVRFSEEGRSTSNGVVKRKLRCV